LIVSYPGVTVSGMAIHSFVPPYVLEKVSTSDAAIGRVALQTLAVDQLLRTPDRRLLVSAATPGLEREIGDAEGSEQLPGRSVRREGAPATGDPAADEAYDGLGATYRYFREVHDRDSLDGSGGPLLATVHYGRDYDNAFFNGERMVFGDGDGSLFVRFTLGVDVIGHELAHGVTDDEATLPYRGEQGALNESLSDVFGSLVKQYAKQQSVTEADWLIGDLVIGPEFPGRALRRVRRRAARQGPAARPPAGLRAHARRQRRCPHQLGDPEQGVPRRGDGPRRARVGRRRPDLVPQPARPGAGPRPGLRRVRRRDAPDRA
jgi:hypothetical protein